MNDCMMVNYIRQNLDMGIESITKVIPCARGVNFKKALEDQLSEYRELDAAADHLLAVNGGEEKNASAFSRISADVMTSVKCMTYDEDSKIAEDMIKGTTSGITKLSRHLGDYDGSNHDIVELSKKVIGVQEKNIEEMKKYL